MLLSNTMICYVKHSGTTFNYILFFLGFYMYIETSSPRKLGDKARFVSPSYASVKGGQCFQFWYHMYGNDIGRLNVFIKIGNNNGIPVWTRAGNRGNVWKVAQVAITTTSSFNVCGLVFLLLAH